MIRVIDDFFPIGVARKLAKEFPDYFDPRWYVYNNALERKKTIDSWRYFGPETYQQLSNLMVGPEYCGIPSTDWVMPDYGLHGGGWHIHARGDYLNPHLDYELHPFAGLARRYNVIIYLTPNWKASWGGELGFWDEQGKLERKVSPLFNRAVIFSTPGVWHGIVGKVNCPEGVYRKSLAVYYLGNPEPGEKREKVLYRPTEEQKGNKLIMNLIKRRAKGEEVYVDDPDHEA